MQELAKIRDYEGLIQSLRDRAFGLQVSRETLEELSGLGGCYVSKLLGPNPVKKLDKVSLGALLGAMGVMLVLVEDADALAVVGKRLLAARNDGSKAAACARMLARKRKRKHNLSWAGNAVWGRMMAQRRANQLTPLRRSEIARKGAMRRWELARLASSG